MSTHPQFGDPSAPDPNMHQIIASANRVAEVLRSGFTEKIYENALALELSRQGFEVTQQANLPVRYDGHVVGHIVADLLVSGRIIIELKSIRWLDDLHVAQCANYLRATTYETCLLINFGCAPPEIKKLHRHQPG